MKKILLLINFCLLTSMGFSQLTNVAEEVNNLSLDHDCVLLNSVEQTGAYHVKNDTEYDIFDGNPDDTQRYLRINPDCQDGNSVWHQRFYQKSIRKGIDSNVPSCDNRPYKTVFFDDFNTLNTDVWTHAGDVPQPWDIYGSGRYHVPENQFVDESGILHVQTHKLDVPHEVILPTDNGGVCVETRKYSTGSLQTKKPNPLDPDVYENRGCFREGRFTIRAKLPKPSGATKGIHGAYWFWAGNVEIDIFEMYSPDSDEIQMNFHAWRYQEAWNQKHPQFPIDFKLNFDVYHEFTLEWDPYKIVYLIDGKVYFTLYRFYQIDGVNICEGIPCETWDNVNITYLDCDDIPDATDDTDFLSVWEHYAWQSFAHNQYLDLILWTGQKSKHKPDFGEMLVDWVRIEQKVNGLEGPDNIVICNNSTQTFQLEESFPSWWEYEWITSPNLTIINESNSSIEVQTVPGETGDAWIDIKYWNWKTNQCFDLEVRKHITLANDPPVGTPTNIVASPLAWNECIYRLELTQPVPYATSYLWTFSIDGNDPIQMTTTSPILPHIFLVPDQEEIFVQVQAINNCHESDIYSETINHHVTDPTSSFPCGGGDGGLFLIGEIGNSCESLLFDVKEEDLSNIEKLKVWYSPEGEFSFENQPNENQVNTKSKIVSISEKEIEELDNPNFKLDNLQPSTAYYLAYELMDNTGQVLSIFYPTTPIYTTSCPVKTDTKENDSQEHSRSLLQEIPVLNEDAVIYPNPVNDNLYLRTEGDRFSGFKIIDLMGRNWVEGIINEGNKEMKIDVSKLPRGVYMIHLKSTTSQSKTIRFVISE